MEIRWNKIYCRDQRGCKVTGSACDNHPTLRWLDLHVLLRHQEEFSQLLPLSKCGALAEWTVEMSPKCFIARPKRPGLTMWSNSLSTPLLMRPRIPPAERISISTKGSDPRAPSCHQKIRTIWDPMSPWPLEAKNAKKPRKTRNLQIYKVIQKFIPSEWSPSVSAS